MTLLDKIKSFLGMDDAASTDGDRDVGVTVERESPATESENAVKGVDAGPAGSNGGGATVEPSEETDTSTAGTAESEPAEDVVKEAETAAETTDEAEPGTTAEAAAEDEDEEEDEDSVPSETVDVIKGIGPTYADRLANAGIETVADLAAADADDVADQADVPKGRLEDWIKRAQTRRR